MATVFTHINCHRATVHDVESLERLDYVVRIDTKESVVIQAVQPITLGPDGEIETYATKYRSIYPIYGGSPMPVAFHCYGKY